MVKNDNFLAKMFDLKEIFSYAELFSVCYLLIMFEKTYFFSKNRFYPVIFTVFLVAHPHNFSTNLLISYKFVDFQKFTSIYSTSVKIFDFFIFWMMSRDRRGHVSKFLGHLIKTRTLSCST